MKHLIYIVDDEELLVDLAAYSLQDDRYELAKFLDPAEAWAAFAQAEPKPSLLVSDYSMKPFDGLKLIEKCKAASPKLKTILISGTAGPEIVKECSVPVDRFIAKPYQPQLLAEAVRSLLSH